MTKPVKHRKPMSDKTKDKQRASLKLTRANKAAKRALFLKRNPHYIED